MSFHSLHQKQQQKQESIYVISTDTATGPLLAAGIKPDAVISIDCQHISCQHFLGNDVSDSVLFLDLASPPLLASRAGKTIFFSGAHPLTHYLCACFKDVPIVDTSGANVGYAAVSLAEKLGAREIEIYGADFSYPRGNAYAKGAYFYPHLNIRQNRFAPSAAQLADFLFKNKSLRRVDAGNSYYYQTGVLQTYRQRLEEKSENISGSIHIVDGPLAPIRLRAKSVGAPVRGNTIELFSSGKPFISARDFLRAYTHKIAALPDMEGGAQEYVGNLSYADGVVFNTLLPTAAAIKRAAPALSTRDLIGEVKRYSTNKIEAVLKFF
jgi:hypothetical protein